MINYFLSLISNNNNDDDNNNNNNNNNNNCNSNITFASAEKNFAYIILLKSSG